jgi:Flp pilus assembly protein CpaB
VVQQPGLVTLALTPEDAEKAIRVSKDGIPYMVLRRPDDEKHVKTTGALTAFGRSNSDSEAVDSKKVLVARSSINEGTLVDDVDRFFDTTEIPANLVPPAAISDPAMVKGKKVEKFLGAKMPLTEEYLVASRVLPQEAKKEPGPSKVPHRMRIYQGPSKQDHEFNLAESGVLSTDAPVGPRPKDGGTEGK